MDTHVADKLMQVYVPNYYRNRGVMSYVSLSTVVVRDGHSVCHRICIYGAMMGRILFPII